MTLELLDSLRASTHELHRQAERTRFMAEMIGGRLSKSRYRSFLVNLHAIYEALEAELRRNQEDPQVYLAIDVEGLHRAPALASDIAAMEAEPGARDDRGLCVECIAYVARLHEIGRHQPLLLLAHAYVRYLGDLNGGQFLRRVVEHKIGAPTAFYGFGSAEHVAALTTDFRERLQRLSLDEAAVAAVSAEAVSAFERHIRLFDELDAARSA